MSYIQGIQKSDLNEVAGSDVLSRRMALRTVDLKKEFEEVDKLCFMVSKGHKNLFSAF
jgi:hypothetical protein